jgi:hypothetical protein
VNTYEVSAGSVLRRVWESYRGHAGVLIGAALVLFALQFVLALLLGGALGLVVIVLFWVLSTCIRAWSSSWSVT